MPLMKSGSEKAFKSNVGEMVKSGHPIKQALAAAYAVKRKKMAKGGQVGHPKVEGLEDPHFGFGGMKQGEGEYMPEKHMGMKMLGPERHDSHYGIKHQFAQGGYVEMEPDEKLSESHRLGGSFSEPEDYEAKDSDWDGFKMADVRQEEEDKFDTDAEGFAMGGYAYGGEEDDGQTVYSPEVSGKGVKEAKGDASEDVDRLKFLRSFLMHRRLHRKG